MSDSEDERGLPSDAAGGAAPTGAADDPNAAHGPVRIYVHATNARATLCMGAEELAERRSLVLTDCSLLRIHANETKICMELCELQRQANKACGPNEEPEAVLVNMHGTRYNWAQKSVTGTRAHFKRWPTKKDGLSNEARKAVKHHEEAVALCAELASINKLKVVTECTYHAHAQLHADAPLVDVDWLDDGNLACKAARAVAVDGSGPGLSVQVDYLWPEVDERVDLAIFRHGRLTIALNVQHEKRNTFAFKEACAAGGVESPQLDVSEVLAKVRDRELEEDMDDVVFKDHPIDKRANWMCRECETVADREREQVRALIEKERVVKRNRDQFERDRLTTYDECETGKYIKGFVNVQPCKQDAKVKPFYIEESQYDWQHNRTPKRIKVLVSNHEVIEKLCRRSGLGVCVLLQSKRAYVFKPWKTLPDGTKDPVDRKPNPERWVVWDLHQPVRVVEGLDLPGFDDDE